MTKRARILLSGILLALMSANFGLYVYSISLPKKGSYAGFSANWDGKGEPRITDVNPDVLAADFQVGDELIAVDGVKIRDDPRVLIDYNPPPGTPITFTIRRAGVLRDVTIQTVPHWERSRFDSFHYISLLFLLTGWAVFLLRPDDKQAWLLALMLATLTGLVGDAPDNLPSSLTTVVRAAAVMGLLFLPVFVHFFLVFPGRSPLLRRWPRLETLLYLPFLFVLLPVLGSSRSGSANLWLWIYKFEWARYFVDAAVFVVIAYLGAGLACLFINYRAESLVNRRRLRVVMAGSSAGFFNLFLLITGGPAGLEGRMPTLWSWLGTTLYVTLPLVPISFVYAIVRHKVIPVSLIIRRGARYVLVSRGSIILGIVIVGLTLTAMLSTIFNRLQPPPIVNGMVSAVIGIIAYNLFRSLHRRHLAPVIDRRFFRQSYDTRQIIADLTESLRTTTSLDHLLELVATKIQAALQAANVTIFLRDEATGDYLSAYSCDYNEADGSVINRERQSLLPHYAEVVKQLSDNGKPLDIEQYISVAQQASDNEKPLDVAHTSLISSTGSISPSGPDTEPLSELKSALLLPLSSKGEMLGIISLGPRLGDLPYSREDEQLLMSVAGSATLAIENALLVEQMIVEAGLRQELEAENEVRAKEFEEARQLQLSMLPQAIPQLPHLEVAAYMKPATEVGGDYYDFHLSDDGVLTVAIGDATGHGLKAGTVVTATKSLFNHLAQESDIPAIFQQSSRALKRMNLRSLFMAMTIAKVKGYQLTLGSAGMPPVLIYHAAQRVVEEISLRGVPLGSLTGYSYRERSLSLAPGDVVVLMSDGYPERFNGKNEMLDYGSAKSVLLEIAILSPQEIIEVFVKVADKWANGRPQDDDMTFVVLKVKNANISHSVI